MKSIPPPDTASRSDSPKERGQATVEFALILPILCTLLFAIVEFGLAFWTYQQVSAAASEGARRAAVSRVYADRLDRVETAVENASPNLQADEVSVVTTSTWASGDPVTVTVSYPQEINIYGVTLFDDDLTVRRTARVEQ